MSTTTKPEIGTPATYYIGSDSYAGKISYVSPSGAFVMFQFTTSEHMTARRFNRCKDGAYRSPTGGCVVMGKAEQYIDPSF